MLGWPVVEKKKTEFSKNQKIFKKPSKIRGFACIFEKKKKLLFLFEKNQVLIFPTTGHPSKGLGGGDDSVLESKMAAPNSIMRIALARLRCQEPTLWFGLVWFGSKGRSSIAV